MNSNSKVTLHTGRKMPAIGLGTWGLTHDTPRTIFHAINDCFRMIDTSGSYGNQTAIAKGIRDSGIKREHLFLITKVEEVGNAYEATAKNVAELQTDYADLILVHRPPRDGSGAKLWRGLIRAKKAGLAKDIGVSNYSEEEIEALVEATGEKPVVNQIEWSPFGHSPDMLVFCQEQGIIIQAYSPLTRTRRLDDLRLENIAEYYNKSPAQIVLRWNLQLGTVPIVKANLRAHQEEDMDIFDFEISESHMEDISAMNEEYSSLGSLPYV